MTEPDYDDLLKQLDDLTYGFSKRRDGGWLGKAIEEAANAIRTLRVLNQSLETANALLVKVNERLSGEVRDTYDRGFRDGVSNARNGR